jgi:hypothetical protein
MTLAPSKSNLTNAPILLWTTKNAFTKGLTQVWMLESPTESQPRAFRPKELDSKLPWFNHRLGKDVFLTKEDALVQVEVMRKARIASHQKSITTLKSIKF